MKSPSTNAPSGMHVAIIMDGSGRCAQSRGWTRSAGHLAGVRVVRRIVDHAHELGIGTLTLHSFSSDNWQRPAEEVAMLLGIFEEYLRNEIAHWLRQEVRVTVIGRRNRVPESLREAMPMISQPHNPRSSLRFEQEKIIQQRGSLVIDLCHVCHHQCSKGLSFSLNIMCQRIALSFFTAQDVIQLLERCYDVLHSFWYPLSMKCISVFARDLRGGVKAED